MMKIYVITLLTCLVLLSCGEKKSGNSSETLDQNARFEVYKTQFIEQLWKIYPGWASSVGYHRYDSVLTIPNAAQRAEELAFCHSQSDSLKMFDTKALSDNNQTDYHLIENQLRSAEWYTTQLKSYEWNPSDYNVCGGFAEMLANDYDSLDTRLHHFYLKMAYVKAFYEVAKQQIKHPTLEHTQLAIDQNLGGVSTFDTDLNDALAKSHLSLEDKDKIRVRAKDVIRTINDYVTWLKEFKNSTPRSFRLGKDLYAEKFRHEIQSSYTAEDIYKKAIAHKRELHGKMVEITRKLWPAYMKEKIFPGDSLMAVKQLIDVLSLKHVSADSFQTEIEHQIPVLTQFIKDKNLIYLDPAKPLVVRKEPAYMAGVAGASISSPGPYDKNGNTYYNVGSFAGWDNVRVESYLREYNHYILQILNIHEAIPGHYTQLIYSNQSPSLIKAIFGNGAMVEGWAVYSERMMLENGYGAPKGSTESSPEMWLMYYKWNLRTTCNTILDYGVHVNGLTKEAALHLLVDEAFQQQAEAEGKWKRVSVTQVQLCSYFTGFTEIYELREELRQKQGQEFNLKQFHETFLSYGSAPVKYIRELMMAEKHEK